MLGLDAADIAAPEFAQVFGGNELLQGMQPYARTWRAAVVLFLPLGFMLGRWAGWTHN